MTPPVTAADPDAPADLAQTAACAEVVVFRSGLTDTRRLIAALDRAGIAHREVTLGMGSATERDRFDRLREWTGWSLLPQVFARGAFVGGADEMLDRLREPPAG